MQQERCQAGNHTLDLVEEIERSRRLAGRRRKRGRAALPLSPPPHSHTHTAAHKQAEPHNNIPQTVARNNGTSAGGAPAGSEQLSLGALGSSERVWRCPRPKPSALSALGAQRCRTGAVPLLRRRSLAADRPRGRLAAGAPAAGLLQLPGGSSGGTSGSSSGASCLAPPPLRCQQPAGTS